ncbi:hypothetical protein DRO47_03690 [Candidatus Bathyarchaeota archaeon]|nr:MAG: hypothetical protein DRO47_03690 [Candidatus Bathyarchaeota archaeon]
MEERFTTTSQGCYKRRQNRGKYRTLSDREHAEICRLYSEGAGMQVIAEQVGRSTKTISTTSPSMTQP